MPSPNRIWPVLVFAVPATFSYLLWSGVAVWKVLILLFLFSSSWHWTHLYKKALSKKHATLIAGSRMPAECFPDDMSWSQFLMSVISSKDKCASHHEALLVDPLWEVSPTMAMAETITQFVLLPLGK
jgi:hypothetical protein